MTKAPPDKIVSFEQRKPDLIREISSKTSLPAIITPDWIQQFVDSCEDYRAAATRWKRTKAFSQAFGKLYRKATFASFEANSVDQKRVLAHVTEISERLHEPKMLQRNLIFFGSCGTGKDHLMYCLLMKASFVHGYQVNWFDGSDLFGQLRHAQRDWSLEQIIEQLETVDILAISDPLFIADDLTPFLIEQWGRIVDYRNRHCLPIWVTVNAESRTVFKEKFSKRTAGRLLQNARPVYFNEKDYRDQKEKRR